MNIDKCLSIAQRFFSGNLMEITVFDGKTVAQATAFPSREPSV